MSDVEYWIVIPAYSKIIAGVYGALLIGFPVGLFFQWLGSSYWKDNGVLEK